MDITAQELNRATLGRQLVLGREVMEAGEAVRRVVALQAQHAAMQQTLYASRLAYRFAAAGLTPADGEALVPELLDFADRPRTAAEVQDWPEPDGRVLLLKG
ncbi:hypothetical protein [Streptomyces hawaiiensis]|uniref:hypothetical protein n=1 Tax=Streptomyces hawaiiensis TaxID=67305 RepID=UPI003CCC7707